MAAALAAALGLSSVPAQAINVTPLAWACVSGAVCFYTGSNGTGSVCAWQVADRDWRSGTSVCSWAAKNNVKSIWNRGTSNSLTGVAYYLSVDFVNRVGCTPQGKRGNLRGTYKPRSHRWIDGACG